nr:beta-glucanase [Actinoplanes digitatis]
MFRTRSRTAVRLTLAAIGIVVAAVTAADNGPAETSTGGSFVGHLDRDDAVHWHPADGWSNGGMFNAGWRADHVRFRAGVTSINLSAATCPGGCSGKPYASGEYRTNELYSYGRFEARMKAVKSSGVVTAFFTYTGPTDDHPWDEIDVEILGKNTNQMQTNYFTDGEGDHETVVDLGFDASAAYHVYAIDWRRDAIRWFVDGQLVHQEDGSRGALPTHPQRIMMSLWPGIDADAWLGAFSYPGAPLTARYDWVRYTRY